MDPTGAGLGQARNSDLLPATLLGSCQFAFFDGARTADLGRADLLMFS
jgi:hypothetical protein